MTGDVTWCLYERRGRLLGKFCANSASVRYRRRVSRHWTEKKNATGGVSRLWSVTPPRPIGHPMEMAGNLGLFR